MGLFPRARLFCARSSSPPMTEMDPLLTPAGALGALLSGKAPQSSRREFFRTLAGVAAVAAASLPAQQMPAMVPGGAIPRPLPGARPGKSFIIFTPCDDGHKLCFWESVRRFERAYYSGQLNTPHKFEFVTPPGDSLVPRARNNGLHHFIAKTDADYLFPLDSDLDFIIGSDGNTLTKKTKTFLLGQLRTYCLTGLSPLTGGTLKFDEITYTGGLYTTFAQVVNALDPNTTVLQYHVLVVNLNGAKAILKLQNRLIGVDQTPVVDGDFIVLPVSVGPIGATGAQGVQGVAGANGNDGAQGIQGEQGVAGTNGTNGVNGIDGVDFTANLQRDMSTSFSLEDSDNNYVIQLKNTSDITITVPSTLVTSEFECGFLRKGTGEVSFVGSGTTVDNPTGFRIKNQYDPAFIERDGSTLIFTLLGNTKV